ncbi:MAG: 3-dehydroquinate synthase [Candidatus Omnitrophota bacterium]|nr:MAG: 3-dehydroquinate synthase [Candidatus Omnitrophota bacterium]
MKTIPVKLKENPYSIFVGYNLVSKIPPQIKKLKLGNLGVVLTTPKILSLYKNRINKAFKSREYKIITVPDGEKAKSKEYLFKVISEIIKIDTWNKKVFLVCVGGGTIGDLGGFVASIYKRGIPCVQVPTTLLAQIDASIGGKTAIDLKEAKNILGTFHQPRAVFIDPLFLKTLGPKQFKEGMAEAIKYGIIKKKELFEFLTKHRKGIINQKKDLMLYLVSNCAQIKARIVEEDEKETKGIRTILNFGHTMAHALETAHQYKKLSHGEAVAIGMVFASQLSATLGKCTHNEAQKVKNLVKLYSLPTAATFDYATLYGAICYDKKFISGKARMVILRRIGKVEVVEGVPMIKKAVCKFGSSI